MTLPIFLTSARTDVILWHAKRYKFSVEMLQRKTCSCVYFVGFVIVLSVTIETINKNGVKSDLMRRARSLSFDDFKRMQANWKYSKNKIKSMFEMYYKCIENANKRENRIQESITAVLALEGQRVELKCPTCQRPDQISGRARLFWQRVRNEDASTTHIDPSNEGMEIKKDMTLVIRHVDVGDAGQYFCVKDGDAEIIYQVDVLFREPQRTVPENNRSALLPAQRLVDHNLEVSMPFLKFNSGRACKTYTYFLY